jgi:hypothetical protein
MYIFPDRYTKLQWNIVEIIPHDNLYAACRTSYKQSSSATLYQTQFFHPSDFVKQFFEIDLFKSHNKQDSYSSGYMLDYIHIIDSIIIHI